MSTKSAPLLAYLFLHSYQTYLKKIQHEKRNTQALAYNLDTPLTFYLSMIFIFVHMHVGKDITEFSTYASYLIFG